MELYKGKPEDRLADIESINNLDMARMSLRWALERLHALEKRAEELSRQLASRDQERRALEHDNENLKRSLALRAEDDGKREAYYQRMRDFISIRLAGKPDAAAAANRELELARAQEDFHSKTIALQREFDARGQALRLEHERLQAALEEQARQQAERAAEAEARRQAHYDELLAAQKAELEQAKGRLEAEAQRKAQERIAQAAEHMERRHAVAEDDWRREKEALLSDMNGWQGRVEEQRSRIGELERALDRARDELMEKARHGEALERGFDQDRAALAKTLQTLKEEAELWRSKALEAQESAGEAGRKAVREADDRRRLEARLLEQQARQEAAEERASALEGNFAQRHADFDVMEQRLLARLRDLEAEIGRRDEAWKAREEALRERDRDWHERQFRLQKGLEEKAGEIERLKRELLEAISRYEGRENKNAD